MTHVRTDSGSEALGVLATIPLGSWPTGGVVDPATGDVYITESATNEVEVINGTKAVAQVGVEVGPFGGIYDPADAFAYITSWTTWGENLTVLNGTTVVPSNLSVGTAGPVGAAYDRADGDVYFANAGVPYLSVVNGTSIVARVNVTTGIHVPHGVAYDPADGFVYATVYDNVLVINGTTIVANISLTPAWAAPGEIGYDARDGDLYMVNDGTDNVSVLNGTAIVATVPIGGGPSQLVIDNASGVVYALNWYTQNISMINGTSDVGSIGWGEPASTAVYDPETGYLLVFDNGESGLGVTDVTIVNGSTVIGNIGVGPSYGPALFDPINGNVYVVDDAYAVTVIGVGSFYGVTFVQAGLPPGWGWTVALNGDNVTNRANATTYFVPNGSVSYSIEGIVPPPGNNTSEEFNWTESPLPYSGTISVDGSSVTEPTLHIRFVVPPIQVVFTESGLPTSTGWSVTLYGITAMSTSTTIIIIVEPGNYTYEIGEVAGYRQTTLPVTGNVSVSSATAQNGTYLDLPTLEFSQVTYTVSIAETGLPSGFLFQATVNGVPHQLTTNESVDTLTWVGLPNGTYSYSVERIPNWHERAIDYMGNLTVYGGYSAPSDGTGIGYSITLDFFETVYSVTFPEFGLPWALSWSVTLGTSDRHTEGSQIAFSVPNGTYTYAITDVSGWHQLSLPYTGSIIVNGTNVSEPALDFWQVTYDLMFTEVGLPQGTNWSDLIGSTILFSTNSWLAFQEPNGTYSFSIGGVDWYHANRSSGTLAISGADVVVALSFSRNSGLLPSWGVPLAGGAVLGGLVTMLAYTVVLRRRRGPRRLQAGRFQSAEVPTGLFPLG